MAKNKQKVETDDRAKIEFVRDENNKIKKVLQININNENSLNNGEFMGVSLFTDILSGKVRYEDAIVVD